MSKPGTAEIIIEIGILPFVRQSSKREEDRPGRMKVAQSGARTFRKIFARQEAHALHSENDPQGWQQQAPRQRSSRYALRFIATLNSGVCD